MSFKNFKLTRKGAEIILSANLNVNNSILFTKTTLGSGRLVDFYEADDVLDKWGEKPVNTARVDKTGGNPKLIIGIAFDNKDITQEHILSEIGLFAKDKDDNEVMVAYSETDLPAGREVLILPGAEFPRTFETEIHAIISDDLQVTNVIDPDGYLTKEVIELLKENIRNIAFRKIQGTLTTNQKVIQVPTGGELMPISQRAILNIEGEIYFLGRDYTIDIHANTITLNDRYNFKDGTQYEITDPLPATYVKEQIQEFIDDFKKLVSGSKVDFDNLKDEIYLEFQEKVDTFYLTLDEYIEQNKENLKGHSIDRVVENGKDSEGGNIYDIFRDDNKKIGTLVVPQGPRGNGIVNPEFVGKNENGDTRYVLVLEDGTKTTEEIVSPKGEDGASFDFAKFYPSVADMEADFENENVDFGEYVAISSSDDDNAKMFEKTLEGFIFRVQMALEYTRYIENTMEDLKISKRYKEGDIVQVLGYHSSDDGGKHIRKKMPSDYRGEDIVVGIDGSIWGIVHDGTVNVSWFGAKGDGINDDTAAIQKAVNLAKVIRIPKGVFYLSSPIRTKNGTTWNETTSQGVRIIGDVTGTTLTRKKPIQQGELEIEYSNQACINIHCSYNIIENLNIEDSPIGIFMGQNVNFEQDNYCSFNKIDKINVKNCGTGFFASNDGGNTYNRFSNLHFISCQISFRTKAGRYANTPYFNRNYLDNIRATRTYIGLFLQDADTNTIQSFHCENIGAEIGGLKFPVPNIYPDICNEKKYIGHLIDRSNKNIITNSTMEKVDTTLINNGTEAVFLNNLYRENFPASRNPVIFVTKPHTFISGDTILLNKSTIGIVTNNKTELPEIMEGYFNTPKLNVNELNTSFNAARKIETKNEHLNIGIGECIVLTPRVITKNNLSILEYEIIFANEAQLYGGLCEGKAILQSSKNANTTARIKNLEHKVSGYSIGGGVISNEALVCTTKIIDGKGVVEIVNNSGYPINAITTITETICKGCDVDVFSIMKEKYTNEMIKEGVYEDFLSYTNLKENYDNTDFLSKRNRMILPEPIPSEKLISFKEKYFG